MHSLKKQKLMLYVFFFSRFWPPVYCPLSLCASWIMAHTGWADNARSKAVVEKVKKNISAAVGGSLDPEAFDCIHVIDLIQKKFPEQQHLKHCLEGLYDRAKLIDPAWAHPGTLDAVPMPPGPQQGAIEGWLFIWQFAHEDSSSLKGRSNMVNILEIAFSILENTFNSVQNPLDVLFPVPGGSRIEDFSVKFSIGFGRSLAIKMILLAIMDFQNDELLALFPVLCTLFTVKCTYNPAPTEDLQRHRSLAAKFQVSESVRPDPIQIYTLLADSIAKSGQNVSAGLPGKIKAYNSLTTVQSQSISELESRVICFLPQQTPKFVEVLKYHWQNYKNAESAVPMKLFDRSGMFGSEMPPEATGVWKDILKASPEKNECFLLLLIGVFAKNLKDALRMKKKPNLRFQASRFRVQDPVRAYYQACLWVHFRGDMQKEMTKAEFDQLEKNFLRGGLDRELTDRCKAMNPTLKLTDFRFIYTFLGREAPIVKETVELEAAQEAAELEQEKAAGFKTRTFAGLGLGV